MTHRIQALYFGHALSASDKEDEQHFAYPVYAALVLAPFGMVSWETGRLLFLLVVPILMALSPPIWLRVLGAQATLARAALWTVLTLASWPLMWGFRLCQVTLPVAFFVAVGCLFVKRGYDFASGLLFALAMIKPQSAGPLLAYLAVWTLCQRRWWFAVGVTVGCGGLLAWSQCTVPGWEAHWLVTLHEYARYTRIGPLPQVLFGRWLGDGITLGIAGSGAALLWRMRGAAAASVEFGYSIALVLALTVAVMPTVLGMNYNDVFLLPGLLLLLTSPSSRDSSGRLRRFILFLLLFGFAAVPVAVVCEWVWGVSRVWLALPLIHLLLLPAGTALWMILNGFQRKWTEPRESFAA